MGSTAKPPPHRPTDSPAPRVRSAEDRALVHALAHNIIPRLVNAQAVSLNTPEHATTPMLDEQDVLAFADLVLQADEASLQERLQTLRERGVSHPRILLELLMPVAAHMGRLWEHDLCDFHDVTLTVGRLQRLLRHPQDTRRPAEPANGAARRRILLSTCRSEQHTFGLSMVAEFFHQAGWDVTLGYLGTHVSPVQLVREQWFDVVGLSLGSEVLLPEFVGLIDGLRRASLNRQLFIIAGGSMFSLHPSYATQLQVDAVITDASQAPARAEQLLTRRKSTAHETAQ